MAQEITESKVFNQWLRDNGYSSIAELNSAVTKQYAAQGVTLDEAGAQKETVAKFMEHFFIDSNTVSRIVSENRTLGQRIRDFIEDLRVKLIGTEYEKELLRIRKQFDKALKSVNVSNDVGTEYSISDLSDYSIERLAMLKTNPNNIIVRTEADLDQHTREALGNVHKKANLHLGALPRSIIEKIKSEVTQISENNRANLFNGNKEYSLEISYDEIRHAKKENMSEAAVVEFVKKLPAIVTEYDKATYAVYVKGGNKTNGVILQKKFDDGTLYAFELVSRKRSVLSTQSLYADDGTHKKEAYRPLTVGNPASPTSETRGGSASTNSIRNSSEKSQHPEQKSFSLENNLPISEKMLSELPSYKKALENEGLTAAVTDNKDGTVTLADGTVVLKELFDAAMPVEETRPS